MYIYVTSLFIHLSVDNRLLLNPIIFHLIFEKDSSVTAGPGLAAPFRLMTRYCLIKSGMRRSFAQFLRFFLIENRLVSTPDRIPIARKPRRKTAAKRENGRNSNILRSLVSFDTANL